MRSKRGITLVEVLVVIVIIAIISATLWLVLGPRAKRSAYETRIRSDLHQIAGAIQMYMDDYDGKVPNFLHNLDGVYKYPKGIPELANSWRAEGPPEYFLEYNMSCRLVERYYPIPNRWAAERDPIVSAKFYPRCRGKAHLETFVSLEEGYTTWSEVQDCDILGVRLDGSVGWFSRHMKWNQECRAFSTQAIHRWIETGKPPL